MQSGRVGDDAADRRGAPRVEPWERLDGLGSWHDLVLPPPSLEQLKAVPAQFGERFWVTSAASLGSLGGDGKRGLLLLFDGPGGTGKTMAARALAGALHLPVLEADLEAMFARGRGEATQLVARLFATAQRLGAVLVLDRADQVLRAASAGAAPGIAGMAAIDVRDLLRRSEAHPGVVIFPTTIADTLRPTLLQRFDGVIAFQSPDRPARAEIWRRSLPGGARVHDDDIAFLARSFSLTGKQIADCCGQGERSALRAGRALLLADIADALERSPEMAARASPGALAELRRLAGVAAAAPESVLLAAEATPAAEAEPESEPAAEAEPEPAAEPEPEPAAEPEPVASPEPGPEPVVPPHPAPEPSPAAQAPAVSKPRRRRAEPPPRGVATPAGTQFTARGFVAVGLLGALGAVVLGLSASEPATRTQTTTTSVTTASGYRTAAVGPVHFSYPTTWRAQPAGTLTPGPGLTFTRAVTLSSGGASGGLLTIGTTSSRGPGTPLPTQFISAELTGTPAAQEVSLGSHRFYRVIDPLLALGARSESVFALASGTGAVVALCQSRTQTFLAQCEQTLATVSAPPPTVLAAKPSAAKLAYAHALNVIIVRLNAARTLGAHALAASQVARAEADAALALGLAHSDAADSVATLSAGPAAAANAALVTALRRVSLAYIHLGDAARVVAPVTYTADRKVVDAANADLAAALAQLQALGYHVS